MSRWFKQAVANNGYLHRAGSNFYWTLGTVPMHLRLDAWHPELTFGGMYPNQWSMWVKENKVGAVFPEGWTVEACKVWMELKYFDEFQCDLRNSLLVTAFETNYGKPITYD